MDFEIDHVILVVQDLDRASADFAALGFTLTAKSSHPFGTANRLISLGGSFIELLGIEDAERLGEMVVIKDMLEATGKDTPWGLVWKMENPPRMHQHCQSIGMKPSPLQQEVKRNIVHPDGSEHEVCYSSFALTKSLTSQYMEGFSLQHRPDATFAEPWKVHENGGGSMTTVILETDSLPECADHLASFGDDLLVVDDRQLQFGAGDCRLRIVPRPEGTPFHGPTVSSIEICMKDIAAVEAIAKRAGVGCVDQVSGVLEIAPRHAAGVELRLFGEKQI